MPRTDAHKQKIGEAQKRAWSTKRQRLPVGATRKDAQGYVQVKVLPGKGAWRPQHILVMEQMLGRPLTKEEVVHHINGVRDDNAPENLFLCRNRSHHNQIEATLASVFRGLLAEGLVRFNREAGCYERTPAVLPRR